MTVGRLSESWPGRRGLLAEPDRPDRAPGYDLVRPAGVLRAFGGRHPA
ncbi:MULTISPECIES: hypothetical protein [Kitasatospora]|nr:MULTISPECIES: hypothetical protein [Kitasatospora]